MSSLILEEQLLTPVAAPAGLTLEPFGRPLPLPLVGDALGFFSPGTNLSGELEDRCLRLLAAVGAAVTDLRRVNLAMVVVVRTRLPLGLGVSFKVEKVADCQTEEERGCVELKLLIVKILLLLWGRFEEVC